MNKSHLYVAALAVQLGLAPLALAQSLQWLGEDSADLRPQTLLADKRPFDDSHLERAAVQFSWAIDAEQALEFGPKPYVAASREYWSEVSAEQLQAGLDVHLTAPGSVLRFSPVASNKGSAALEAGALRIRLDGRVIEGPEAFQQHASAADLKSLDIGFPQGSTALQLDPKLGHGLLQVQAEKASGRYVVHVFEPASAVVMELFADRAVVSHGEQLEVRARLVEKDQLLAMNALSGVVTAPDGRSFDLQFEAQKDGSQVARLTHDAQQFAGPGLWEVHAFGSASKQGTQLLRDAKTSFASSLPSARIGASLDQLKSLDQADLGFRIAVEAAQSGRYELRGVLYGSAADGSMKPAAVAHSAAWLERGQGQLELRFDEQSYRNSGLKAPFEVRGVELLDQGRQAIIERRARGFRLAD